MQNKDTRYLNSSRNLYANHAYDYPSGSHPMPNEHYGNSSYPVAPNSNVNPYGSAGMAGLPYENNHGSVHGHFSQPPENSFMPQDMNNDRKGSVGNLNYESAYNIATDQGTHHNQAMNQQIVNMPSDHVHSPMSSNVQSPHQPSNVNMIQSHHQQQNIQAQFGGQPPNSWGRYQELHPRVQNMHHHHNQPQQPPHFHNMTPNHVQQQFSHETPNSGNVFNPPVMRTNSFHYQHQQQPQTAVPNVSEVQNMSNPLQSLQDMVMSDNSPSSLQQKCPTTVTEEQSSSDYEKCTGTYLTPDDYQSCLPSSGEATVMFLSPPPSSGESIAVPVETAVGEQSVESQSGNPALKHHSENNVEFKISDAIQMTDLRADESKSFSAPEHSTQVSELTTHDLDETAPLSGVSEAVFDVSMEDSKSESQYHEDNSEMKSCSPDSKTNQERACNDEVKTNGNEKEVGHSDLDESKVEKQDIISQGEDIPDEKFPDKQEVKSTLDRKFQNSEQTNKVNLCDIDVKLEVELDVLPEVNCTVSADDVHVSQHESHETSEELVLANLESEEYEYGTCDSVSANANNDGVLSVKTKTLRKTVRAVKFKNLKKLSKFSQKNGQAFLAVAKPTIKCESDVPKTPVRVVIHRIRADSANETWRIPKADDKPSAANIDSNGGSKKQANEKSTSNTSPQIIILSPASPRKKIGKAARKPRVIFKSESKNAVNTVSVNEVSQVENPNVSTGSTLSKVIPNKKSPSLKRNRKKSQKSQKMAPSKIRKNKTSAKNKKIQKSHEDNNNSKIVQKMKKMKDNKRFNGPYIHMIDSSHITIVNVAVKGDEKDKKPQQTKAVVESGSTKRPQVGHTSTLSPNYDAFNIDRSWTCIFCHKGSHTCGLGDLFGPYYVKETTLGQIHTPSSDAKQRQSGCKRKRFLHESGKKSFKRISKQAGKIVTDGRKNSSPNVMDLENDIPPYTEEEEIAKKEIWIHEDCAVWCQTVSVVGQQVHGLEEAVQESRDCICSVCKMNGATLGCWNKFCSERYHFSCAVQKGCDINIEKFALFCFQHKGKPMR